MPQRDRPILLYHVRKSAGQALATSFFDLSGEDPEVVHDALVEPPHRAEFGGRRYVGWAPPRPDEDFFFAFTHEPSHAFARGADVVTIVSLRDPVKRLLSHYRMLIAMRDEGSTHPAFEQEKGWLGEGFDDFLDLLPERHLLNQLYTFSAELKVGEARRRIREIDHVVRQETFEQDLARLGNALHLPLRSFRVDRTHSSASPPFVPSDAQRARLHRALRPEYKLLRAIRSS